MDQHIRHDVKRTTAPLMGSLLPARGFPGMVVFVYLPLSFLRSGRDIRLAFNRLLVDTRLRCAADVATLMAVVPPLERIHARAGGCTAHVTLCMVDNNRAVRNLWDLGDFVYEPQQRLITQPWLATPPPCPDSRQDPPPSIYSCSRDSAPVATGPCLLSHVYNASGSILSLRPQRCGVEPHRQVVAPTDVLHHTDGHGHGHPPPAPAQPPPRRPTEDAPPPPKRRCRERKPEASIAGNNASAGAASSSVDPPAVPFDLYLTAPLTVGFEMASTFRDLVEHWSDHERTQSRRIVRFWGARGDMQRKQRQQQQPGPDISTVTQQERPVTIYCQCEPVASSTAMDQLVRSASASQSDRLGVLVSCIAWEGDHYVTSVDVINILQELLGRSFTVQTKNRIRRNLEGFAPITARKGNPTSSLYKRIMAFTHPKPRNIEKDIKVFRWSMLPSALAKVVEKYFSQPAVRASSCSTLHSPPMSDDPPLPAIASPPLPPSARTSPGSPPSLHRQPRFQQF